MARVLWLEKGMEIETKELDIVYSYKLTEVNELLKAVKSDVFGLER